MAIVLGEEIGTGEVGDARKTLEDAAREIRRRKWMKWMDSGFYGGILRVKLEGTGAKEELDLGRGEWRSLEQMARRYTMVEGMETRLFCREVDGQLALCVWVKEMERVLQDLQDGHWHYAAGTMAGRAQGKYFWPTRQRDIGRWVEWCEPCQRMARIQQCREICGINQFSPMDMVGMDFIGSINPPCEATGAVYILLVVDYFSRFVLEPCQERADQQSTMRAFVDKVVPILGWPKSVNSDNGSHFAGASIRKMWEDHGVMHFTAAISHPQSVGLSERYVQMVIGRIWPRCISAGTSKARGLLLKDALIDINVPCIRIQGYKPSEIHLEFNPTPSRHAVVGDGLKNSTSGFLEPINVRCRECNPLCKGRGGGRGSGGGRGGPTPLFPFPLLVP